MTDYTKSTNFTSKDTLPTGNALKIIKGTEFDTEFNAIAVAVATKADTSGPTLTGTTTADTLNATTVTAGTLTVTGNANIIAAVFEGATADAYETTLTVVDPTADRTISLPNKSGTVALTSDVPAVSNTSGSGTYAISGSTALTVTITSHGRAIGDIVYLNFTSGTAVSGEFTVASVTDANNYVVTYGSTLTTSGNVSSSYSTFGLTRIASVAQTVQGTSTDTFVSPSVLQQAKLVSGTAKAYNWNSLTTNTSIDFTSIPSWVKRITVMFKGVSTNGTSPVMVQLGDSGGIENNGYSGSVDFVEDNSAGTTFSTGFAIDRSLDATSLRTGHMTICLFGSNNWNETSTISNTLTALLLGAGDKTLSDTLTQIRITTVGGADYFDAGSINILYE